MGVTWQGVAAGSGVGMAEWGTVAGIVVGVAWWGAGSQDPTAVSDFGMGTAAGLEVGLVPWGSAPCIPSASLGMARWGAAAGTWTAMGAAWWRGAPRGLIKAVGMRRGWQGVPAGTGTGAAPPGRTATARIGTGAGRCGTTTAGTGMAAGRGATAPWGPMTAAGTGWVRRGVASPGLLRAAGPSMRASRSRAAAEVGAEATCREAASPGPTAVVASGTGTVWQRAARRQAAAVTETGAAQRGTAP